MNFYDNFVNERFFFLLEKGFLGKRALFTKPVEFFSTNSLKKVKSIIEQAQKAQNSGYYVVGYITYEAAYAFYELVNLDRDFDFPLIWFGAFEKPNYIPNQSKHRNTNYYFHTKEIIHKKTYFESIKKIKEKLEEGEIYQLNYTFPIEFDFCGKGYEVYESLRKEQKVDFGAYIRQDNVEYLCFSPELFFQKEKKEIICKPMKGTIHRSKNKDQDNKNFHKLLNSAKDKSENLMITDLIRNDLGKIAKVGTVKVKELFHIEPYETIFQMTSKVQATLKESDLMQLCENLFPCGSITGAPKLRSMEFIKKFEKKPRELYTGTIGVLKPNKSALFNIAIRTIKIHDYQARINLGSGIVWESEKDLEYKECLLKGKFFLDNLKKFSIFESILVKNRKPYFLKMHISRMANAAQRFHFLFNQSKVLESLENYLLKLNIFKTYKLKVILNSNGSFFFEVLELVPYQSQAKICLSKVKVFSQNFILQYKTSIRQLYDEQYQEAKNNGYDEIIFENEKGEVTEGSISNIFILKNKVYYTPPLKCGVLNGIFRKKLLQRKNFKEKVFFWKDVLNADKVFICNSVRGIRKVIL